MDRINNPFSPGAGSPPPELVGRDPVLEDVRILLGRLKLGRSERSMILTGLRGVGKTVLLNKIALEAEEMECEVVLVEAHENKSLGELLAIPLRQALFKLDRIANAGNKVKRALAVLKSFADIVKKIKVGNFEVGLDIEPERGIADSGDLEIDLPDLLQAVADAAKEKQTVIAVLIDEIQYLSSKEISALILAMHKVQQRQLPLAFIGAGLPILPALVGDSKSYAERLLQFPDIGPLLEADVRKALQEPVKAVDVEFADDAIDEIFRLTKGYPYFLQEWGYQTWNRAESPSIDLQVVQQATPLIINRLDENFFRVRFDRLTPTEKHYLRVMAELGEGSHRTKEVGDFLGRKIEGLSTIRQRLIKKGMIYSPTYGEIAFTVPLFDEFMKRAIPDFNGETA